MSALKPQTKPQLFISSINIDLNEKTYVNHERLSSLEIADILEILLIDIDEIAQLLAVTNESIPAGHISGMLRSVVNSTKFKLLQEGGLKNA